jgi:gp45 sliding clamp, C terminal
MSLLLTPATVEILKNFATITETLLFPKGNTLQTRSVKKNTYAEATITEKFPKRFTIYDLNQFLSVITQFDKPTLHFDENDAYVKISDESGGLAVKYHYGDESLAYCPDPKKKIELPSTEVEFQFTEGQFKSLTNLARTLDTPELALESDGKTLKLTTLDTKNSSTNTSSLPIGDAPDDAKFLFVWKIEYLKLIPGTYTVSISKEGLSRFQHKDAKIVYHIMLEANSLMYDA